MTTYLPLLSDSTPRHGSRSRMTCHFRCGDACDQPVPNPTDNTTFQDVAGRALARRSLLKTAAVGAGAVVVGGLVAEPAAAAPAAARGPRSGIGRAVFRSVAPNKADKVTVPNNFRSEVRHPLGRPGAAGRARFDVNAQTGRRRRSSSATTATTWACCRCAATTSCWWSTTSTPTRT